MTIIDDHIPAAAFFARFIRAVRVQFARFHLYWFVECVETNDPFLSLSSRDRADLPTWHPFDPEG